MPSLATPPYVPTGRTAASATTPSSQNTTPFYQDPSSVPLMPGVTIQSQIPSYGQLPTLEDLYKEESVYPTEQRYGGKTKKKKTNGSIVKAIKNL
jgi:hypothetical protein